MNLKEYREFLGLTQQEMAEGLGIAQPNLSRSEKNWPNVSMKFAFNLTRIYDAHMVFFPGGELRFATPEETTEMLKPTTQEELSKNFDHLPDVLSGATAEVFNAHQKDDTRHPFTCMSPEGYENRCLRSKGESEGVLSLEDDVVTCPCRLQHTINRDALASYAELCEARSRL